MITRSAALQKCESPQNLKFIIMSVIAWFSCGATSAVACKMALREYRDVRVFYIETGSAHPDNYRFIEDCQKWLGVKIEVRQNPCFHNVCEVLEHRKFINSPFGAPCTLTLKKLVRGLIEKELVVWDGQVFGFDWCKQEINRSIRFKQQYPQAKPLFPLIENHITKQDALAMLKLAHIELPVMYRLGYHNNNCLGCVKGGIAYWNKIRVDFPDVFAQMARLERKINATCIKDSNGKIFLDELDPNRGKQMPPLVPDCSLYCNVEFMHIMDKQTEQILNDEISIKDAR